MDIENLKKKKNLKFILKIHITEITIEGYKFNYKLYIKRHKLQNYSKRFI